MKVINWLLLALLVVLFALLGLFNSENVLFNYIVGKGDWPLAAVMLVSFLFGALLTLLLFGVKSLYWKTVSKSLEQQLHDEHRQAEEAKIKTEFDQQKVK